MKTVLGFLFGLAIIVSIHCQSAEENTDEGDTPNVEERFPDLQGGNQGQWGNRPGSGRPGGNQGQWGGQGGRPGGGQGGRPGGNQGQWGGQGGRPGGSQGGRPGGGQGGRPGGNQGQWGGEATSGEQGQWGGQGGSQGQWGGQGGNQGQWGGQGGNQGQWGGQSGEENGNGGQWGGQNGNQGQWGGQGGNQGQWGGQGGSGGNRPRPTRPPVTTTTESSNGQVNPDSPVYRNCLQTCNSRTTNQYNPVCGTDNVTYDNSQKLECARRCNNPVETAFLGTCAGL